MPQIARGTFPQRIPCRQDRECRTKPMRPALNCVRQNMSCLGGVNAPLSRVSTTTTTYRCLKSPVIKGAGYEKSHHLRSACNDTWPPDRNHLSAELRRLPTIEPGGRGAGAGCASRHT